MCLYRAAGSTATERRLPCEALRLASTEQACCPRSEQTTTCRSATSTMYRLLASQSTAIALTADRPACTNHAACRHIDGTPYTVPRPAGHVVEIGTVSLPPSSMQVRQCHVAISYQYIRRRVGTTVLHAEVAVHTERSLCTCRHVWNPVGGLALW